MVITISKILRFFSEEHFLPGLLRITGRVCDRLRGSFFAMIVGWPDSYLGANSIIRGTKSINVAKNISIGRFAWIEAISIYCDDKFSPIIKIGQGFSASERLHISAINRIEIGDNCLFGSCVYVSDHNHGAYKFELQSHPSQPPLKRKLVSYGAVVIGANVWVGDNVVIIGPVQIGNGAVIGANSVVTRDVPENVMVCGIPAKIIKTFDYKAAKWEK